VALIENTVSSNDRAAVSALFEQMVGYHPIDPHWYLPLTGTDPIRQCEGYGSVL
jgi:hypothetical protein